MKLAQVLNSWLLFPCRVMAKLKEINMAIEDLRREVAESAGAVQSAIVLIEGLRDRLDAMVDSAEDLAALQAEVSALSAELSGSTDSLAAAVVAPSEPPAPVEPVVE